MIILSLSKGHDETLSPAYRQAGVKGEGERDFS
jgi:hypothetical protein